MVVGDGSRRTTEKRRGKERGRERRGQKEEQRQNREAPLRQVVEGSKRRAVIGREEEQETRAGRRT